jgi:hypothetical protein
MNIDHTILTLIVFTPLAGALLLALLPDRGKTMQWAALAVTSITFLLTLHLPFHYSYASEPGAFQFEQNVPWIASPLIHYHLGVDGLSMWLMVLTGVLAPLGVLISWRAIDSRKKLFYIFFLLQQVAMMGIFASLDMFLYYAFWEMSLVPMTILIATFGRTDRRRRAAIKYFLYAFIPSGLLLVAMLWLYAQTGTFDLPTLAGLAAHHAISPSAAALWIASLGFLLAFSVKVPIFPLHGWLVDAINEAPTAAVMVLVGKTALYSILRFSFAIFPEQSPSHRTVDDRTRGHRHRLWRPPRPGAEQPQDPRRLLHARPTQLHYAGHLHLHHRRTRRRNLPDTQREPRRRHALHAARPALRALWHLRHSRVRWPRGQAALDGHHVRHHRALHHRATHAEQLRRRVSHPLRLHAVVLQAPSLLDRARNHRRHSGRGLHAQHDSARLLQRPRPQARESCRLGPRRTRAPRPLAHGCTVPGHGTRLAHMAQSHRRHCPDHGRPSRCPDNRSQSTRLDSLPMHPRQRHCRPPTEARDDASSHARSIALLPECILTAPACSSCSSSRS